ncbi:penicillin-binding protein 1C [Novosphingobium sp. FSY-8]|uniref:peptidoglycan glycosyltransferase n=2 Tax=Novosphingobium ovatum TaxID=1908523 RepID=A0ABW9X989_9SPHN|nr:penicillin-binding protein 1C [Novosphingobium ovatum]
MSVRQRWIAGGVVTALAVLLALDWATHPPSVPDLSAQQRQWQSSAAWLYDRHGRLLEEQRIDFDQQRLGWTKLSEMPPELPAMLIAAEDRRFRWHGGVDWLALGGSLRDWLTQGRARRLRGASTITMQTAAYVWPQIGAPGQRGWRAKLRQIRAARALEDAWSKDEILEAYLNLAPFRGEAQGVAAAAQNLFGKMPAQLDRREVALLVAMLPNPGAEPAALAKRACRLIPGDCPALTALAHSTGEAARNRTQGPGLAPHLAAHLLTRAGMKVTTTLDAGLQRTAIAALRHQLQGLGARRVRDGAVVVLDNASGDVLAYVGGVGLGSTAAMVDGAAAHRQAGSTLKPHLYAQLIERKWLTAASILDDSPVQLDTASGLYVPRNYDNQFMGPVSARRALANSLNVPAVRALLLAGVQPFRDRLADLGYDDLEGDGAFYGFSLALGSAEVSLLQQANAYRTLANLGRWSPIRLRADEPVAPPRQVLDPGAAWIIGDMLADASARANTFGIDSALRLPFWAAAKTGTSKAMRDNWCVGYSDRYTVAVWVGNLEGDPMRAVSGTAGAAPVWRDIMLALHARGTAHAPPRPANVVPTRVTFAVGHEPPRVEWFLAGTQQALIAPAPGFAEKPHITNPVSGAVYAIDPDIPPARQTIGVTLAGDVSLLQLRLDGRPLPPAGASQQVPLIPGSHLLTLADGRGRMVDQVRFSVR